MKTILLSFLLMASTITSSFAEIATPEGARKACIEKDSMGCVNLAVFYYLGKGIEPDILKAVQFYNKACDMNNTLGCSRLGRIYEFGSKGMPQDHFKAVQFYNQACILGDSFACDSLGYLYEHKQGFK